MLVQFSEQVINDFLLPSFSVAKGEIVIVKIPGGACFRPLEFEMVKILTGKGVNDAIKIIAPLKFVEHFKESYFQYHFYSTTIGRYHNKYANKANPIYKNVYEREWITPKIKVNTLAGTLRKKLSLYTTLSWTNNIVFDLHGVDPQGGQEIYSFVKTIVNAGGAAILFDQCDEFKDDCTSFVEVKYLGDVALINTTLAKFQIKQP